MKHKTEILTIWFICFASFIVSWGCTLYHPRPLDERTVKESLRTPDMDRIRVQAKELRHPLLKPIDLNPSRGLTPEGAAIIAVIVNPTLKALRDKRGIAAAQLLQAGILPNPQISYSLDFPTGGNTQGTVNAYGLNLSWDVMSLIVRGAQVDAAQAESRSVDLDIAWQEWQTALAAKTHAYNLIFLTELTDIAKRQEKTLQENLAAIRKAFDSGDVTVVDLAAAQTALDKARNMVLIAEQQCDQERLSLNRSIGFPPQQPVTLRPQIALPVIERIPSFERMMEGLQVSRLDLVALRFGYQSQEERVRAAVLAQFPSLVLGISRARDTGNVRTTGLSIGLTVPLFNRNQGQIAVERATRTQLFDEYLARLHEARSVIASTIADARSIEKQIDAAEHFIPAARTLVETYRMALLEGHADVVTYYNALNDLAVKQIDLLTLKKELCDRMISLEIASGQFLIDPGDSKGASE